MICANCDIQMKDLLIEPLGEIYQCPSCKVRIEINWGKNFIKVEQNK
jgi:hypothetical protein